MRRRTFVLAAGSTLASALAGCLGGDTEPTTSDVTETSNSPGTETPAVKVPEGDATVTLTIDGDAPDFESVTVDIDRIEFRGDTGTEDVTVQIRESGVSFTTHPHEKTYFRSKPFPSGAYTSADIYLSVSEATLPDGSLPTFDDEPPLNIDLVIFDDPLEIASGSSKEISLLLTARQSFGDEIAFSTGFSSIG